MAGSLASMPNNSTAITVSGRVLLRGRLRKGLTLRDLSARCAELGSPINYSFLSRIERGISQPSARVLPVLAEALGLEVDDLLAEVNPAGSAA